MATDRGRYRFWHVPSGQTTFSIASEPLRHPLESLRGSLGFDLAEGTSFEEAMRIANMMNTKIAAVTLTK